MLSRVAFRPQTLATFLIICGSVLMVAAVWKTVFHWHQYQTDWESGGGLVLATRLLVLAAGPSLVLAGWLRFRRSDHSILLRLGSLFPFRVGVYLIVLCLLVTSLSHAAGLFGESRFLIEDFFNSIMLLAFTVWALFLLTRPVRFLQRPPKGRLASADLVAANLLVIAFSLEVLLDFVAKYSPSPLFWDERSITSRLAAFRPQPGHPHFSSRFNSLGYHDQEFFPEDSSSLVVGLLADSFGVGVVPHGFNFATIAERILQEERQDSLPRVVIHNFGVVSIGMPEYAYLLKNEVLPYRPSLVLLMVFVGNDIMRDRSPQMGRYVLQNWLCLRVPYRLLLARHHQNKPEDFPHTGKLEPDLVAPPTDLEEGTVERPTFPDEEFLRIERRRLEVCNPETGTTPHSYRDFFKWLSFFESELQEKLVLAIIPDEFQVNDPLYDRLLQQVADPSAYVRDEPQIRIRRYCEKRGIPYLDLLPVLRAAEKEKRTYHLNDTHWNVYGNRVVGEALGRYLVAHLNR